MSFTTIYYFNINVALPKKEDEIKNKEHILEEEIEQTETFNIQIWGAVADMKQTEETFAPKTPEFQNTKKKFKSILEQFEKITSNGPKDNIKTDANLKKIGVQRTRPHLRTPRK